MAVPKTSEARCRNGSVQTRQVKRRLQKHHFSCLNFAVDCAMRLLGTSTCSKKEVGIGPHFQNDHPLVHLLTPHPIFIYLYLFISYLFFLIYIFSPLQILYTPL